jgi:tetratricopeptide (TPR) repeat protein
VDTELIYRRGTPPDAEYTFKHALVQDAAYSTLLRSRRQQLHARIAATLEGQFPEIVAAQPALLAHHCEEAGQTKTAIEYWRLAAEASISRSANVEAVRQIDRALEVLRRLPESAERDTSELRLLVPRGVGLQALHGYGSQQVHSNYTRANEICRTVSGVPELIPVLRGLYMHNLMRGSLPAAHEIGSHLLRLADGADDEGWRVEARFAFGQTLAFYEADFVRARDLLAEGAALYNIEKHGRHAFVYGRDPGVYCLALGGWVEYFLGYPDTALRSMRRAIFLADAVEHPLSHAAARAFTTQLLQWLRSNGVRALATETIGIAESEGLPFFHAWAETSLGCDLISSGEFELGRAKLAAAIDAWLRSGSELMVPYFRCLLAEAHSLAGECEIGLAETADAIEMAELNGDRCMLSEMHRLAGRVFESAERLADAEQHYEQAICIARRQHAKIA